MSQTLESNPTVAPSPVPDASILPELPVTVIEPTPGWRLVDLRELWRYRELLFILTWRDIKVRYKQTVLGAAWAVLQPLATMLVFSVVFGRIAGNPESEVPYPLFVFAGLLPWYFFQGAVSSASQSVVGSQALVTKVYFPRLLIPMSAVGVALVDFGVAFGMLLALMAGYLVAPTWPLFLAPLLVLGLGVTALGIGTLLAALTVAYRDFRYVVPFMIQLWLFATPTVYLQADVIGPRGRFWLAFNPAYGIIANFRASVLGQELDLYSLAVSATVGLVCLVVGLIYFRRVERSFADII